jgi:hypothetical protein
MTADWFLFWQQHYARPTITEFELEMGILQHGIEQMSYYLSTAVAPAFKKMAEEMTRFMRTVTQALPENKPV